MPRCGATVASWNVRRDAPAPAIIGTINRTTKGDVASAAQIATRATNTPIPVSQPMAPPTELNPSGCPVADQWMAISSGGSCHHDPSTSTAAISAITGLSGD